MITTPQKNSKRKYSTKSGLRHLPLFRRVARANTYSKACNAIYRLAIELLKIGQTQATIVHDLHLLSRDAHLPKLIVAEVVAAAAIARKGGAK